MIVCEGMDGSGKSSLVERIATEFGLPIHERAATSKGGPREHLFDWAVQDIDSWHAQELAIYDRHPFVSEWIYGPIVRERMDDRFLSCEAHALLRKFKQGALMIFCDPGLMSMRMNIHTTGDNQMNGVSENFNRLAWAYRAWYANYDRDGMITRWNYTNPNWDVLALRIRAHITDWYGFPND